MLTRARLTFFIALLLNAASLANAQDSSLANGTISGRVTVGGKAAPGVTLLLQTFETEATRTVVAETVSGLDGRFSLSGIAAGRYNLSPVAPALVAQTGAGDGTNGRPLTLSSGQTIEGLDFALTRGGVIGGQVTDAEGKPVVAERLRLIKVTEFGDMSNVALYNPAMLETDDRGMYRIYGIPDGRYILSAGESARSGAIRMGGKRGFYNRTFYPSTTDELKAQTVVVTPGSEVLNVDIRLGRLMQTHDAAGRIVNANGRPVANMTFAYVAVRDDGSNADTLGYGSRSDLKGEFRIVNLLPGSYAAFVTSDGEGGYYSDPVYFDVFNDDVSGLEIKLVQGSSVSGAVVVEGANDSTGLSALRGIPVGALMYQPELSSPGLWQKGLTADGLFRVQGLHPGKLRIALDGSLAARGLTLLRVERNGVEQRDGIDITPDEQVTGVRIILAYRADAAHP